ncbi:MAG: hypothetical protein ACO1OK_10365 [Devosia sp.]
MATDRGAALTLSGAAPHDAAAREALLAVARAMAILAARQDHAAQEARSDAPRRDLR